MRQTTVQVQHPEGAVVLTGLPVQIDQASMKEKIEHAQFSNWRGTDLFKAYTLWWPAVLAVRGDVLIDELYTDPDTGAPFKYRVTERPKNYERDHQEFHNLEVVVGT